MRASLATFAPHARAGLPSAAVLQRRRAGLTQANDRGLGRGGCLDVAPGGSVGTELRRRGRARGLPTAITLAAIDVALAHELAHNIATPTFRPYVTDDMIGAEAGGAVKNVLAIACGIVEGRELGRSAHAALITRGFAELTRLAVALGGEAETVAGLCGLGDLGADLLQLLNRAT